MKPLAFTTLLLAFMLNACAGAQSEVKKSWRNTVNTVLIENLTPGDNGLLEAGTRLHTSLENSVQKTGFLLAGKESRFHLKYKILEYDSGSRLARMATLGTSSSAQAKLKVKVALYNEEEMVGGWVVDSWLKGGIAGGSEEKLFAKAAEEIAGHLKGDF